jgi:hypothetical protein
LQRFVERDCPESHIEIKGSTVSKPFKAFEQFVNAWHWVGLADDPFLNLTIFLGGSKRRCSPFAFVALAKDIEVAKAVDFIVYHALKALEQRIHIHEKAWYWI